MRPLRAIRRAGREANKFVFVTSALLILAFVYFGVAHSGLATETFEGVNTFLQTALGWWYILAVGGFVVFVVWLAFSRFGSVRLGADDSEPDYGLVAWFAMLFSAGMGIGLIFWAVAEPLSHYTNPPYGDGGTSEAVSRAMDYTFLHWGLHAWAIYSLVALSIAFTGFRLGHPLSVRSVFHPLIGDRIYGRIGDAIDIFAIFGTLFGVAASLGLGVQQVNAGLAAMGLLDRSLPAQIGLVVAITAFATTSVVLGLTRGIRRLSLLNLWVAGALLGFVILAGPTVATFDAFVQNVGSYLQNLPSMSFYTEAFTGGEWQQNWTTQYWPWWISWSPFVGIFIARVSRGRTIREFILGVLLVPSLVSFLWMTAFGNTAIMFERMGVAELAPRVADPDQMPTALFGLLEAMPLATITSGLAIILIVTYFVTSSDSGSLVIDIISSGGSLNPPVPTRIFWASLEGIVAIVLLVTGGLTALQAAVITTGLPFSIIMVLMCVSLVVGLRANKPHKRRLRMRDPDRPVTDEVMAEIARAREEGRQEERQRAGPEQEPRVPDD